MNNVLVGILGASPTVAAILLRKIGCRFVSVVDEYVFMADLGVEATLLLQNGPLDVRVPSKSGNGDWSIITY